MNEIFEEEDYVKVYIDDILIHSKNKEEHENQVKKVLKKLHSKGISINFEKSIFQQKQIKFLGHYVDEEGIKPDISVLTKAIENFRLNTKKDAMKIAGVINWLRPFLPRISEKIISITDLLKGQAKNRQLKLSQVEKDAILVKLKKILTESVNISYPTPDKPFKIFADASDYGYGSIIIQEDKIVGLHSGKFQKHERNYTVG